ncbi:Predicted Zn-dependent peptidase [Pedobacter westerhofensis]|uniref:Predicted Zn-dependent peptidase n=1 Tax=Pedobacter westerhofensis TaxID=425512 RepID=A0A521FVQ0_9SPHI|nr:pitrilysin family protein [Pedobacter westerhofensis]SMO99700.1 Predicted Zn-dependent peptidase [Pedobacter westerhofensis]
MNKLYIIALTGLLVQSVSAQKLDRSKLPKPGPAPAVAFSDPVSFKLPNGITVFVVENHKLPKVTASFIIDAGPRTEGAKAGVLDIMGSMLGEGTATQTKVQFDEAVDQIGANVRVSSSGGSATALTRYFEPAFLLMADALRNPEFPQASFEKLKSQALTGIKSNARNPSAISKRIVPALSYGVSHPMGEFATEKTVTSITLDDVKMAYQNNITPSRGFITFVGDIKPDAAKVLTMKAFGNWKGTQLTLPKLALVSKPSKTEIDVVDMPNAVQSEITVTNLVDLPLSSPDYHAVLLANQILGGGADAKLFRNLREKHGFTYGAYSSTGSGRFQAAFTANAAVRNEKVDSAVVEFLHEIKIMRTEKVSEQLLQSAKNLYNGSFALGLEDPARTAGFARNIVLNNLPKDFYLNYLKKINAVTAEDVLRVSQKYFGLDDTRIIIVGKKDVYLTGLSKLGYQVNLFDTYAVPVNTK